MLTCVRALAVGRLGAVLVALALTGVPQQAARAHELEGEAPHRCHCRHAPGERCHCGACRRAVQRARLEEAERAPPCHRAQAIEQARRDADQPEPAGPCLTSSCGDPEQQKARAVAGIDPFFPPPAGAPTAPPVSPHAAATVASRAWLALPPPTPPPRAPRT